MEQLNSDWSEQNMEQKTKIETMLKKEDELKVHLVQAEERIQSERKRIKELKNTYSNEVLRALNIRSIKCFSIESVLFLPTVHVNRLPEAVLNVLQVSC